MRHTTANTLYVQCQSFNSSKPSLVVAVLLLLPLDDLPLVDDVEKVQEVEDAGGDAHDAERARRLKVPPTQRSVVGVGVVPREARHA